MGRFHHYSVRNQMLITLQRSAATRVARLKRWNELGRKVKKGEKGIHILAPSLAKVELEVKDPESGQTHTETREQLVGFHPTVVFDLAQTEGEPLPEPYRVEGQVTPEVLAEVAKACPLPLYLLPFEARQDGLTDGKGIFLHPRLSQERRLLVFFHEWGTPCCTTRAASTRRTSHGWRPRPKRWRRCWGASTGSRPRPTATTS